MGWIPKNPLPHDFCGRPPCGLCYVWQNDATDEIIEAVDHMLTELLGEGVTATDEQRATVEAAVRRIHEDNIRRNAEPDPPPDLDAGAAAFTEADNRRRLEMQLNYAAKLKAKADAYKPVMRNKSIDELGVSEAVLKEIEARRDESLTAANKQAGLWVCDSYDHNESQGCSNPDCFKFNKRKSNGKRSDHKRNV